MEEIRIAKAPRETVYEEYRPLLFSLAYRMVGSASDAEDIVQEAFLRLHRESSKGTDIDSPKAWLSTVTTRLASIMCSPRGCVARATSAPGCPNLY
jgi:RNA polymerase sigma factor (sigma-70 family)